MAFFNEPADFRTSPSNMIDARVVLLTHYIPLYQVRVFQELTAAIRDFRILLSTPIEPNRDFTPDWSGLNVTVQDTWTMRRRWKHRQAGFEDPHFVHLPYDTTRRLHDLKPDVVMSLELGARSAGAAWYCRRHPQTKLILCTYMSERTEQGRGWLRQSIRRRLVRSADAVTYNGPSCHRYLKQFDVPDDQLFHLPYAADDRTVYRGPIQRDDKACRHRFLVVGQLTQRKGVMPLLEQLCDYCRCHPNRRIEVNFAGDGPLHEAIKTYPAPPNLDVHLLGNIAPATLAKMMRSSGALIASTLADEWMLVVNEALQAGLPVIGSIHAQAVTTLVKHGDNGWCYDPADKDSLGQALDAYFGEPESTLQEMCQAARNSVADRTPAWAAAGALDSIKHVLTNKFKAGADFHGEDRQSIDDRSVEGRLAGIGGGNT